MSFQYYDNPHHGMLQSLAKLFDLKMYRNVSKNNRLIYSYIYGFDSLISSDNRLIGSSIQLEDTVNLEESCGEKERQE